jgi:hypothetical protein
MKVIARGEDLCHRPSEALKRLKLSWNKLIRLQVHHRSLSSAYKKGCKMYRPIVRQRFGKHVPARANAYNRTPIARQRISKHA